MSIAPMSETKVDEWDRMIDINIKGVLYGIAAATNISKQESGHFINLSSAAGVKYLARRNSLAVLNLQLVLSLKAYVTK
jgi:NADP-dependent 3-hydroxy acid dehydrogenase YdfG